MQPYFNNIANRIKARIISAEKRIDIAVSWFTNTELFEPLLQKLKEDVEVQLIIVNDTLNIRPDGLNFQKFIDYGGKLFLCNPNQLMHNKYCIIDEKEIFSGSYNWTYFAENKNLENILFSDDALVVKQFKENFETIKLTGQKMHSMEFSKPFVSLFITDEIIATEKKLSSYQFIKTIPSSIYKVANFQPITGSKHFQKYVTALDISSNGKYLVSAGGQWIIQIWEIETGNLFYYFEISDKNTSSYPSAIKFSPDSSLVTMNDGRRGIVTLSVLDSKMLYNKKYRENVGEVTYSLSGTKIAICSTRQVYIVEANTGDIIETIETPFNFSRALEFMNNDNHLLIASQGQGLNSHLKLYSFNENKFVLDFMSTSEGIKAIKKIDEFTFIASGWNKDFYLWNIKSAIPKRLFNGHTNYIFDCDIDSSADYAVSGSIDSTVRLWDIQTGNLLNIFKGHGHGVHSVRFDVKHSVIFSSDEDGKILTHAY